MVVGGDMYLDPGILVKLLAPEPETAFFERELQGHSLATSELALVEVRSALFAKERAKLIPREQWLRAGARFAEMIESEIIKLSGLSHRVLRKAMQVIQACRPDVPLCPAAARMRAGAQKIHVPVFPEKLPVKI